MNPSLIVPGRLPLLLALLLAGASVPATASGPPSNSPPPANAGASPGAKPEAAGSPRPDSPPDWSGAQEGDFVEYSFSAEDGNIPRGSAHLTVGLQVLSVDAKEVRVAVSVSPPPALFARGLLVSMRRAAPDSEEDEYVPTFYGQGLKEQRDRVFVGDTSFVCQKFGGDVSSSHGPMFSGCVAPDDRSLYLGGGLVSFSTSLMTIRGRGYSYSLDLIAVGRGPLFSKEIPPLAFREGSGYERFSQSSFDVQLEKHTFHTRNGVVQDEEIHWTKEEGAKPQRNDRVFQGIRLTRMDVRGEKSLLEYVWDLVWLSLHVPYTDDGRPAKPTPVTVGGNRVSGWKHTETWNNEEEEGKRETVYAWDPWALKDAPVEVRFLPFTSKLSTWPPGRKKEVETEEGRTLRWY